MEKHGDAFGSWDRSLPIIGYTRRGLPVYPIAGGAPAPVVMARPQTLKRQPQTTVGSPAGAPPFIRNSRRHTEIAFDTGAIAFGAIFGPRDVPALGYLRDLFLDVVVSGGDGSGTPAVYHANNIGPFNALRSIQLLDITGAPLVDVSSLDLCWINLFGGYNWASDFRLYPFALNLAAVAAAGAFSFQLKLPAELLADAFGSLPNENAAASFKVRIEVEAAANVYSTNPAPTVPTVDVRADLDAWTRPLSGQVEPPGIGSTAYWSKQVYPTVAGQNTIKLTRVGNFIHTLILIFRSSTPATYDVTGITDFQLRIDGVPLIGPTTVRKHMTEVFANYGIGWHRTAADVSLTAAGLLRGVIPITFRDDVAHPDRGDSGELWLPTTGGSRVEIVATLPAGGAAGTMTVLTGDLIPEGPIAYQAIS